MDSSYSIIQILIEVHGIYNINLTEKCTYMYQ